MRSTFTCIVLMLIGLTLLHPSSALSQNVSGTTVKGKVIDENGKPLVGATINIKGTNQSTITDSSGNFSLAISNQRAVLVFSFVGFAKQEISVNGRSNVNVQLQSEAAVMNDVVVVGYGTVRKKDITGAVSS